MAEVSGQVSAVNLLDRGEGKGITATPAHAEMAVSIVGIVLSSIRRLKCR